MNRTLMPLWLLILLMPLFAACAAAPAGPVPPSIEGRYEGRVVSVLEESTRPAPIGQGEDHLQILQIEITQGPDSLGTSITAENLQPAMQGPPRFVRDGQSVVLQRIDRPGRPAEFVVVDLVRRPALYWLAAAFALMVALIGGWRGLASLLGLAISFIVLLTFVIPRLLAGHNPILITVVGSVVIMVVTLYLSHGVNRKTTTAIVSTAVCLSLTGVLASFMLGAAGLFGLSSDEAFYLQIAGAGSIDLRGLLLGAIIIGTLGALDDITVSQAAIIFALRDANPSLGWGELYRRAMSVGKDHIASLVNTLVLAYAGASMPLLLLFTSYAIPTHVVLNFEVIATEVVRTLVGSMALVLAVPLTTAMAASVSLATPPRPGAPPAAGHDHHGHAH